MIRKTYDAASRLTSVTTNNGDTTVAFGYDDANRQVWEDQTLTGSPTRRVLTPRDNDGNRSALQVAGSYLISYDYTQRNQLAHLFDGIGRPFCNFIYDASGNMTNVEMRWVYPNGANFAYDDLNRPATWENTKAGNAWFARSHYQYDKVGREAATWRDEQSSKGEKFWYTTNNQLAVVEYNADQVWTGYPANWDRWVGYSYTPDMLNRSSVNDGGTITNYSFSSLNQYTGVGGLSPAYNDGNFNLTGFNGATYVYGYTSQLISASKGGNIVQFTYDGLGRCVRRVVNGAARIFTYDGWKPMLEWDGAGNWLAQNIYGAGPDEILARYDSIGRALTYKHDKQGNVVALLGNDGNVVEKYSYDAFGQPTVTDNWGNVWAGSIHENRFMFTGREWIKELGIYDYRNRFYHPGLGRFLQGDPLGLQTEGVKLTPGEKALFFGGQAPEAFSSSELNLFRYCGDDPVDNSDPFGLVPPGEGLMDLARKTVQEIKEAMKDNIRRTLTEKSPDGPGGKPRSQEHRTMAYDNGKGERKTSTETGRHENGIYPYTEKPKNPFNQPATPAWDSHSHISGSGKPYAPRDFTSADRLGVPSGVQSATGGPLYIYVPSATRGGEGGLFRIEGARLINDATGQEAPH